MLIAHIIELMSFIICAFIKYYWGDQAKEDEMGGACSA
jgi:hypothetical protein